MKRIHLHFKTRDLNASVRYYTALFGAAPSQLETDYAKWILDDPRAHVSVSTHGGEEGFDHAGISIDDETTLNALAQRLRDAGGGAEPETATTCCYARSNKFWSRSVEGATWELFQTYGAADHYGAEPDREIVHS